MPLPIITVEHDACLSEIEVSTPILALAGLLALDIICGIVFLNQTSSGQNG